MSGTKSLEGNLQLLEEVLDRQVPIDSLGALVSAVDRGSQSTRPIEEIAIGIDSNVFLRLATHKKSEDIVDFLGTKHRGPLILPGQTVQEYWNNQYAAILTLAADIKRKFEVLRAEVLKIDANFGKYASEMQGLLDQFGSEYGYVYDSTTARATLTLLTLLKARASVPYVPRMRYSSIAMNRKRTKTPPGYKDDGDGDFYVWVDFLYGLLIAKAAEKKFVHAVIVTHDKKVDWSLNGVVHPILAAEVQQLVAVSFEVWTIEQLYEAILNRPGY